MSKLFEKLEKINEREAAYDAALTLLQYDNETQAPIGAIENTSKIIGILSMEAYNLIVNDEVKNLLIELNEEKDLNEKQRKIVEKMKKEFDDMEKIPPNEYQEFTELVTKASSSWSDAKDKKDFKIFEEDLRNILVFQKKFAGYCKKENQGDYDYYLNENDEGFGVKECDEFFLKMKETIVPLMKEIKDKNDDIRDDFLYRSYDIGQQKEFCDMIAKYIGFDSEYGITGETEHPFTTSLHNKDVRFTNHFHENQFMSACFSAIHEGGHALFEMGVSDEYAMTPLGQIDSMAIHESQSRLYENNIGRSIEFWTPIWPSTVEMFPEQLSDVTLEEFIKAINKSYPSLIRTEADELTYSLHILIRYEIEKMMMDGSVDVSELPKIWNEKYEEYLGVVPKDDSEGVLQDIHWTSGVGYFPSYSVGSAISAQIMHQMKKDIDVNELLLKGDMDVIRNYLKDNVHQYGSYKKPKEVLKDLTGEEFNPQYYIDYLSEKYRKLYNI